MKCSGYVVLVVAFCLAASNANAWFSSTDNAQQLLEEVKDQSARDALTPSSQHALSHFYHALSQLESGRKSELEILELGDSHTANDFLSGELRSRFQDRFGNAGRGTMPPGVVYRGIGHREIKPEMDNNWTIANSLKEPSDGPYGISGFTAKSKRSGAKMKLTAVTSQGQFDEATVDYLMQPEGGKFEVLIDDHKVGVVDTSGKPGLGRYTVPVTGRANSVTVITLSKGIVLSAWGTRRQDPGVILSSHGVVGATAELYEHWHRDMIRAELAHLKPALIIVEYGTNEGFADGLNTEKYAQAFSELLQILKTDAPTASILVVGPPDGERMDKSCRFFCGWHRPPMLDKVRQTEQQIAMDMGTDFWNWAGIMPRGMSAWVNAGLARPDHVHFKITGYEAAADQLFERLMTGYNAYKNHSS